ncbi:hypothetical protein [Sphaerotilus sp.]|uniref:hypothetical protein n=1 Tax=Sphaerotilus sp. TaxID=2093942 RepID=UPI0034E271F1
MPRWTRRLALLLAGCIAALPLCQAQSTPAAPTVRVRGTVQAVGPDTLTVKDRSGDTVELVLPAALVVSEVFPIARGDIQPGSFIGVAALPQSDGTRRAIAVTVFPEAARGTGEGDRPFDLLPQSTMTNATVAGVATVTQGRALQLQLQHKDGEARIVVPDDAPIVTFRRADRSLLVVGASVSLQAQVVDGQPTAARISVGRAGFVLPY